MTRKSPLLLELALIGEFLPRQDAVLGIDANVLVSTAKTCML